jgi:hypothetical protein
MSEFRRSIYSTSSRPKNQPDKETAEAVVKLCFQRYIQSLPKYMVSKANRYYTKKILNHEITMLCTWSVKENGRVNGDFEGIIQRILLLIEFYPVFILRLVTVGQRSRARIGISYMPIRRHLR